VLTGLNATESAVVETRSFFMPGPHTWSEGQRG
jgi:hypothetical protein